MKSAKIFLTLAVFVGSGLFQIVKSDFVLDGSTPSPVYKGGDHVGSGLAKGPIISAGRQLEFASDGGRHSRIPPLDMA